MDGNREAILDLVVEALLTDGAHHKQWYLERILVALMGEERAGEILEKLRREGCEPGIPP